MTPGELRAMQDRINRGIAARSLALLRTSRPRTDREWSLLVAALFALVSANRRESRSLAQAYYASQSPTGSAPRGPDPVYAPEFLSAALSEFREGLARGGAEELASASQASARVVRHVEQGGRDWVVQASRRDGVRFARMDPRPPCCGWCLMFISRGPVYLRDDSTSAGFLAHDFDTCVPVPVFSDGDWPGREQYEAAEEFYVEHAAGSPGEQLQRLRRAVAEHGSPI